MEKKEAILGIIVVVVIAAVAIGILAMNGSNDEKYTVTYDPNYESAPEPVIVEYKSGTEINYPVNPLRHDYVVGGWFLDKECTKLVEFPYKVTSNVTLYAGWTEFKISDYVNPDFLTDTPFGKYLVNVNKMTTGSHNVTVEGTAVNTYFYSGGNTHLVFKGTDNYSVVPLVDTVPSFNIPAAGVLSLKSVTLNQCYFEFIIYEKSDGYYVQNLVDKEQVLFSKSYPEIVMNRYVILDDVCYGFTSEGKFDAGHAVDSEHRPLNGSGTTFCELVEETDASGNVKYHPYILDSDFNVKRSLIMVPDNSHRVVFLYLGNDYYLLQFAIKAPGSDFTYCEDGVKYLQYSYIVNGKNNSTLSISLEYPAFTTSNLSMRLSYLTILKGDIKNVVSLYQKDSHDNLILTSKMLVMLGSDGTIEKVCSYNNGSFSLEFFFPTTEAEKYYLFMSGTIEGKRSVICNLIDGKGNPLLTDVMFGTNKYYIRNDSADFNIYDTNGNAVGDYSGKTYVGHTNNLMFFKDSNDGLYMFKEGSMSKVSDYRGELVCMDGCYGYKTEDGKYTYFTENGAEIVKSDKNETMQRSTLNGNHIVQFYMGSGIFKVVEITSS